MNNGITKRVRKYFSLGTVFLCIVRFGFSQQTVITVNTEKSGPVINKNIYGHFAEHLGHCIYNGFYVGDTNKVILNTDGVRNDVINALKKLKVPVLGWPGGCFADTCHWKDGIGPKENRPAMINKWWGGVTEDNSFGTHDFLNMCERIGADPYLAGNVGSGTVQELTQWVQYVTFDGTSPMSKWRKQNGRDKPWNAKMLPVSVKSTPYIIGKDTLPSVSASASIDKNGITHISLVNIDPSENAGISLNFKGIFYKQVTGRILVSAHIQDYNSFEDTEKIKPATFHAARLNGNTLEVKLPPASVVVLELKN